MAFIPKIQAFWQWWGEGLYSTLPDAVRKWFRSDLPRLVLSLRDAQHVDVLWQQDGKTQTRGEFLLDDATFARDCIPQPQIRKPHEIELRLNKSQVLYLQRYFPEAVKENLRQVVGYQLDRLTPFTPDNVLYDAQQVQHDKSRKEILADIRVVPRSIIDGLMQQLSHLGIEKVSRISVADAPSTVNLLQDQQTQTRGWSKIPLYCFLTALAIALLAPLAYKYRRVGQIDEAVAMLRHSSAGQLEVRDKLMAADEALKFLEEKRKTSPVALDVVEKLSALLPADTWLQRLTLEGKTLAIQGESSKALTLIDVLEEAPEFSNVRFKSPVTRNKDNNSDRFQIEASVEVAHAQ